MKIIHILIQIKPVRIRAKLITSRFNLFTAKILRKNAGMLKHFFSYALIPISGINRKFRNLRNTFRMMELLLKS